METWTWIFLIAVGLILLDRLLLVVERRGWIYYRKSKASPGSLGSALMQINGILEPQKSHVAYVQRKQHVEEDREFGPGGQDQPKRPSS